MPSAQGGSSAAVIVRTPGDPTAMLYGVSPFDPVSFAGVTFLLSAIALLASYVPARRAARVDPVEELRQD